jgi:hypothetical protein
MWKIMMAPNGVLNNLLGLKEFGWHYNMGSALSMMLVLWLVVFAMSRVLVKFWLESSKSALGK